MAYWTYNPRLHSIMALESQWQGNQSSKAQRIHNQEQKEMHAGPLACFPCYTVQNHQCQPCLGYIAAHSGLRLPTLISNQDSLPQTGSRANLI